MPKTQTKPLKDGQVSFAEARKKADVLFIFEKLKINNDLKPTKNKETKQIDQNQLTGNCPFFCKSEACFSINIEKKVWSIFGKTCKCTDKKSGSIIDFVAYKLKINTPKRTEDAAKWILDNCKNAEVKNPVEAKENPKPETATEKPVVQKIEKSDFEPLKVNIPLIEKLGKLPELGLDFTHPLLKEKGLSEKDARTLGIGFVTNNKSTMKNKIVFPVENSSSQILSWVGVSAEDINSNLLHLPEPKNFNPSLEFYGQGKFEMTDKTKYIIFCFDLWKVANLSLTRTNVLGLITDVLSPEQEIFIKGLKFAEKPYFIILDEGFDMRAGVLAGRLARLGYTKIVTAL